MRCLVALVMATFTRLGQSAKPIRDVRTHDSITTLFSAPWTASTVDIWEGGVTSIMLR